jgi:hypothetical protein
MSAAAKLGAILTLVALASAPGIVNRSIWHDEAITLLEVSDGPTPRPDRPVPAGELKGAFEGRKSASGILEVLRETDIHPPVYYWALSLWRAALGSSVEAARTLSLVATLVSVVFLFALLRAAGAENPFPALLLFGCATFTVHLAHETRNYALGTAFLLASTLLAWRALPGDGRPPSRGSYLRAAASGLAASAAFLTGYLTIFWIVALLGWFAIVAWRRSRGLAVMLPAMAAVVTSGLYLGMGLHGQLDAPGTGQDSGFDGILAETRGVAFSFVDILANHEGYWGRRAVTVLAVSLLAATLWRLVRGRREAGALDRRLVVFFAGVIVTSAAGIAALDVVKDKHLYRASRYFAYALPALAVLLALGVSEARRGARRLSLAVPLLAFVSLQLGSVNWSSERCRGGTRMGRPHRSVARAIAASSNRPVLALIGVGNGRGDPWSSIYEMRPDIPVVFVHWTTDPAEVVAFAAEYEEIWMLRAFDGVTAGREQLVFDALVGSGRFADDPPGLDPRVLRARRL